MQIIYEEIQERDDIDHDDIEKLVEVISGQDVDEFERRASPERFKRVVEAAIEQVIRDRKLPPLKPKQKEKKKVWLLVKAK